MTDALSRASRPPLRLPVPGGALLLPRRPLYVTLALAGAVVVLALVALGLGDYPLTVTEVLRALVSDQGFASTIVLQWRAPRVAAAIVFGAALAVSGALFQTLTRNPLGSPDVIGFATGSYTGAIIAITVVGQAYLSTAAGALLGGLGTAFVVYLLAYRGGLQGFRLIIVGIAVTAMLSGLNTYLLLRAQTEVAMAASIWGAGSISLVGWGEALPAFAALAGLAALTVLLIGPLRQLELGDDAARAHGVRVERGRLAVLVVGVALIAIVTASAGPIAFVALAAPQIARRLTRAAGIPVGASACAGAALLLGADVIAQHVVPRLIAPGLTTGTVPVGVVTVVVGGLYLVALLVREARKL